jgi:dihydrofolate reductase
MFNLVSLDGFFSGPTGDIDWHNVDEEFNDFALQQLAEIGTLVFGRVTYELMASYWPTPEAKAADPQVAAAMNRIPKVVFSRTLRDASWEGTRVLRDVAEVDALKRSSSQMLALFGSADLASSLTARAAIDEYRVMVNPIVLGSGKPLFKDQARPLSLQLLRTRSFRNGNVLLSYRPKRS